MSNNGDSVMSDENIFSIYDTSRKVIQEYVEEIERHNHYKTARCNGLNHYVLDNRGALIDLYESCMQQDAHLRGTLETLESQVLGERYMLAKQLPNGQYSRDIENTKKIQGTEFIKIIKGTLESKLFGYTLIEIMDGVDEKTGRLSKVNIIERRNVLPNQHYVVQRQGIYTPGWDIDTKQFQDNYILVNNGDLGMFAATTPLIIAKKFTFANYVNFAQTYGQPIIQAKSVSEDDSDKKKLADQIANASRQRIIVTGLDDELVVHSLSMSNSEKIYTSLIEKVDSQVSNLVLGSESMAGATQSYVGSTNAHQDIFRDRIEVYREFIEDIMNEQIIPRLIKRGMIDGGLEFKYSNKLEMSNEDRIKLYDILTERYEVSSDEINNEFGITVGKQLALSEEKKAISNNKTVNFLTGRSR